MSKYTMFVATAGLALAGCSGEEVVRTCLDDPSALGCAPPSATQARDEVIRIGLVAPLTGDASGSGEGLRNGAYLAFDEIDWAIGRYGIELVDIDSESANLSAEDIASKYRQAIEDQDLVAGLLNWHSSVSVALMDPAADARMAHLFPFGATDEINRIYDTDPERYGVWCAKGWPQPGTYVSSYLDLMQCLLTDGCDEAASVTDWSPSSKRVFVAREAGSWGDAFEQGAADKIESAGSWWADNGWSVAGTLEVNASDDATTLANKARTVAESNPSVVLMTSTADNVGQFLEQVRLQSDPDPLVIVEGLGWSSASLTSAGQAAIGVLDGGYGPYNGDPAVADRVERFQIQYELEFGEAPSTSSGGLGYDYTRYAIEVLRRALDKHGRIDREGVLDVYTSEVCGGTLTLDDGVVMGRYRYDPDSVPDPVYGLEDYYFPVYQYQDRDEDGEVDFATVFPAVLRDADVVVP